MERQQFIKNGQQLYTQQADSGSFSSLRISDNRPIRYSGTDVKVTKGNIAEMMAYNRGLTKDEVNTLSTYIYDKYASMSLVRYPLPIQMVLV